jgi:hypothetical protein
MVSLWAADADSASQVKAASRRLEALMGVSFSLNRCLCQQLGGKDDSRTATLQADILGKHG